MQMNVIKFSPREQCIEHHIELAPDFLADKDKYEKVLQELDGWAKNYFKEHPDLELSEHLGCGSMVIGYRYPQKDKPGIAYVKFFARPKEMENSQE